MGQIVLAILLIALYVLLFIATFKWQATLDRFVGGITSSNVFTRCYAVFMAFIAFWTIIAAARHDEMMGWFTITVFVAYTILSMLRKSATLDSTDVGAIKSFGMLICKAKQGPNLAPFILAKVVKADKEWQMRFALEASPDVRNDNELYCQLIEPVQLVGRDGSGNILDKPMQVFPVITFTGITDDPMQLFGVVDTLEEVLTFLCEAVIESFRNAVNGKTAGDILNDLTGISRAMTAELAPQLVEYGLAFSDKGGGVKLSNIVLPKDIEAAQARVREQAGLTEAEAGKAKAAEETKKATITAAEAEKEAKILRGQGDLDYRTSQAQAAAAEERLPLEALNGLQGVNNVIEARVSLIVAENTKRTEVKGLENLTTLAGDSALGLFQGKVEGTKPAEPLVIDPTKPAKPEKGGK